MDLSKIIEGHLRSHVSHGDESVQQGWILADGTILDLLASSHMESAIEALGAAGMQTDGISSELLSLIIEKTGAIRVCAYNYTMLHLLVLPTTAQIDACCRIARYTKQEESGAGMEIFWHPADRLVQIKPLTAGRVRKTLEALPGVPKGK